jgi:hypothetical protein
MKLPSFGSQLWAERSPTMGIVISEGARTYVSDDAHRASVKMLIQLILTASQNAKAKLQQAAEAASLLEVSELDELQPFFTSITSSLQQLKQFNIISFRQLSKPELHEIKHKINASQCHAWSKKPWLDDKNWFIATWSSLFSSCCGCYQETSGNYGCTSYSRACGCDTPTGITAWVTLGIWPASCFFASLLAAGAQGLMWVACLPCRPTCELAEHQTTRGYSKAVVINFLDEVQVIASGLNDFLALELTINNRANPFH